MSQSVHVDNPFGSALTEADYRGLAVRWITSELADAAGLRRVDSNYRAGDVRAKGRGLRRHHHSLCVAG